MDEKIYIFRGKIESVKKDDEMYYRKGFPSSMLNVLGALISEIITFRHVRSGLKYGDWNPTVCRAIELILFAGYLPSVLCEIVEEGGFVILERKDPILIKPPTIFEIRASILSLMPTKNFCELAQLLDISRENVFSNLSNPKTRDMTMITLMRYLKLTKMSLPEWFRYIGL